MKKVLVIGAHGKTGQQVINRLKQSEMIPVAGLEALNKLKSLKNTM